MPTLKEKEERQEYQRIIQENGLEAKLLEVSAKIKENPPYPKMRKDDILKMAEKLVSSGKDYNPPKIEFKPRRMTMDDLAWIFEGLGAQAVTGKLPLPSDAPSAGVYGMLTAIASEANLRQRFYLEYMEMAKPSQKDTNVNNRYADPNKALTGVLDVLAATTGRAILQPNNPT